LFCDGRDERFVVCEESERTTFKKETEMFGGEEGGQQFPVESGVAGFGLRKFFGEEGEGLP
jgi:hypothetical protein